ncbi:deoxyribose-phosphate aldolase [Veillonella montpellierensis]|uniref:deoxyribose-phosphate aldolase n=1 Tax=Veillonella montpellierensis TaxID=187328 RepID=UPI0023F95FC7|nr:deoxyribose-phosphate aldolase [Veillonella montpellierensis]
MLGREILSYVDHTMLKVDASWQEIQTVCKEAIAYNTASVCIPPAYVKRVSETYDKSLIIGTVVGFPAGYNTTAIKMAETEQALHDGAKEIDMMINLGAVKNYDFLSIVDEIRSIKSICDKHVLKVIIETCYLTETEKVEMAKAVSDGGADYIKTSTGFGVAGATLADVRTLKQYIAPKVKIKAAGGITDIEDMIAYLEAGCSRIGSSRAVSLLKDTLDTEYRVVI